MKLMAYGLGMIKISEYMFEIKGQISNQNYHIKYLWQTEGQLLFHLQLALQFNKNFNYNYINRKKSITITILFAQWQLQLVFTDIVILIFFSYWISVPQKYFISSHKIWFSMGY